MVVETNAAADPGTVVVVAQDAAIADSAVVGASGSVGLASGTEGDLSGGEVVRKPVALLALAESRVEQTGREREGNSSWVGR